MNMMDTSTHHVNSRSRVNQPLVLVLEHFYCTLVMIIWKHVTLGGKGGGKPRTPPPFFSTDASLKLRYQEKEKTFVFNVTMSIAHVHIDPKSA